MILIQFFIILTLLALVEIIISLTYQKHQTYNLEEFINSVPDPFVDDPDFEIIVKNFNGTCSNPALLHIDGISKYASNFSCGGVTYFDEKRLTIPIAEDYIRTIHIFGGSTVWGTGSTDENTIPSLLALSLENMKIRVLNYGFASYVSSQQNSVLKAYSKDIKEDDVVIFYDGGNDFWNGVMLGNSEGSIVGYNIDNRYDIYVYILKDWLSKNLKTYQLLSDLKHKRKNLSSNDCSISFDSARDNIAEATNQYAKQINLAKKIAHSKGAKFYHFLQPSLFDTDILNGYEKRVLSHNPCWSIARDLKEEFDSQFLKLSKETIDLSEIFNNKNVFFDYIHVSAKGNKYIIKYMLDEILL